MGKVHRELNRPVDLELISRMKSLIRHRGPDDDGEWSSAPAGFGFQRLAIIDVACGHQPMHNEDQTITVVFNGEIYNFPELRAELEGHGHRFATNSDTEVIVHGYEQWGTAVCERLRGMFAFAVYDHPQGRLMLARDRVGKKPLFYALVQPGAPDEGLLFASELKALLADPALRREVDPVALNHYLTFQYVPHPRTIYKGAHKLEPAHYLLYQNGHITTTRYWDLQYQPKLAITPGEAVEASMAELSEATRIRLMSEVPLGCFLSGGIDSSLVAAAMRMHTSGKLRTFSIGFKEAAFNELPYARQAAELLETEHEEFVVEPDAVGIVGRLAWHFDEPFADSSAVPTWYLSEMTRRHVTVALNGDGGDESFAGYERYRMSAGRWQQFQRVPAAVRRAAGVALWPAEQWGIGGNQGRRAAFLNRLSLSSADRQYIHFLTFFTTYQKQQLFTPEFRELIPAGDLESEDQIMQMAAGFDVPDPVDRRMKMDILSYLPGALLPKVDRTTMGNSLEGRSPFLDHKLMEFAARLPADIKLRDGELKWVLKQAGLKVFSAEFLNRPKQGFGVPIGEWFRTSLKDYAEEMLLGSRARGRGWFNMAYVRKLFDEHQQRRQGHEHRLWSLLMLEAWARTYLDETS